MSNITLRTFSPNFKPKAVIDFAAETSCAEVDRFKVRLADQAPIVEEVIGGIAQFGPRLQGPARASAPTHQEVVINSRASDSGLLVIEDGAIDPETGAIEWTGSERVGVCAWQSIGLRFTTSQPFYRIAFEALEGESVGSVQVLSQVRDIDA